MWCILCWVNSMQFLWSRFWRFFCVPEYFRWLDCWWLPDWPPGSLLVCAYKHKVKLVLFTWPTYLTSLHGLPTWPTYLTYLTDLLTWLTYPTQPTWLTYLSDWPTYLTDLPDWLTWLTYLPTCKRHFLQSDLVPFYLATRVSILHSKERNLPIENFF